MKRPNSWTSGAITAGFNPFIGLDGPPPQALLDAEQQVSSDICFALYGDKSGPGFWQLKVM